MKPPREFNIGPKIAFMLFLAFCIVALGVYRTRPQPLPHSGRFISGWECFNACPPDVRPTP